MEQRLNFAEKVYVGVAVSVTPVGKVVWETVGVTMTVGETERVFDRVLGAEIDGVVEVVSVFVGWVVVVSVRVGGGDRVMTGLREPVAEIVDVLVVAPEVVGASDVVEVLELEVEPVMVALTEEVFDERADREATFVSVGFAVVEVVDVVVGLSVCCRVERTVRVSVGERRGVAVVVLVWATLRAGGPLLVNVGDAVVVLERDAEAVSVADNLGVVVVFSDPEWVVDAVVVLLPGGDLVYVAQAVVVLVKGAVRVVVLLWVLEADVVAELVVVLDLVAVRLTLGDDVAVLEVVTDPVLVGVVRIDPDRRVVLEKEGDADDVLDTGGDRDRVVVAEAVLDLAPECVPVGEREAVLVMDVEPVTVLELVVVFVAVAVPVVVREP